jgi:hypothetical protein
MRVSIWRIPMDRDYCPSAEQADAAKPAMTPEFQIGSPRRGFGDPRRWAK